MKGRVMRLECAFRTGTSFVELKYAAALFISVALLTSASPGGAAQLSIYTINVAKGASTLIVSNDYGTIKTMLVDSGYSGTPVAACLNSLGIHSVNYTILTHGHDDHYGGFNEITGAGITLGSCYSYASATWNGVSLQKIGVYNNASSPGTDTFDLGGGVIARCVVANGYITGGAYKAVSQENSKSVGILVTYEGFDFIVAGDCGGDSTYGNVETPLADAIYTNNIDVLSVNHHGSAHSSNAYYCHKLAPPVALISVGSSSNSTYNFPSQAALDHLNDAANAYPDWDGVEHIYVTAPGNGSGGTAPNMTYEYSNIVISYAGGATYTVTGGTSGTTTYFLDEEGGPTATPTATATVVWSPTPTRTPTPAPTATRTPTRTPTPAATSVPPGQPTPTPTNPPAPTEEPTRAPTEAPAPPEEPTPTPTEAPEPPEEPIPIEPPAPPQPTATPASPARVRVVLEPENAVPGSRIGIFAEVLPVNQKVDAYLAFQTPEGMFYFRSVYGDGARPKPYVKGVSLTYGWQGNIDEITIPPDIMPGEYMCFIALFPAGTPPSLNGGWIGGLGVAALEILR